MVELPRSLADALIEHAREGKPLEVCGIIGIRDGRIVRLERARNAAERPQTRFLIDDEEDHRKLIQLMRDGLDEGFYHSHPATEAYPSPTDIAEWTERWPGVLQLMVSLRHDGVAGPELNAYRVTRDGEVVVEELRVVNE